MSTKTKAKAIISIEKLRLLESEIFRLTSKYNIKTVDELDRLLQKGKLTEKDAGEDLFILDQLMVEKEKLDKQLQKLSIKKSQVWESLQNLLGFPKQNFRTS